VIFAENNFIELYLNLIIRKAVNIFAANHVKLSGETDILLGNYTEIGKAGLQHIGIF